MSISLSLLAAAAVVEDADDVTDLIGLKHCNIQIQVPLLVWSARRGGA